MRQTGFHRWFAISVAASLLSVSASGADWPATPLSPSGKWTIDYADDHCTLSRDFGASTSPLKLSIEPSLSGPGVKISLIANALQDAPKRSRVSVTLLPSGASQIFEPSNMAGSEATESNFFTIGPEFLAAFPEATGMQISFKQHPPITLDFGLARQAAATLKSCQDDLVRRFGIDPATLVSVGDASRFVPPDSFPVEAIKAATSGRVVAAIAIGRDGKPTGCKAIISSGSQLLDTATCAVFAKNVRVDAAQNGPETRWAIIPLRWILPGHKP